MHPTYRAQAGVATGQDGEKTLQLVHLRVVDVVARAHGQRIRLLRQGRQRMLVQRLHMRSQRPVRERLIRPVHGQKRLPAWVVGQ